MGPRGLVPKMVAAGALLLATSVAVVPAAVAQDTSATPGAMEMQGTHDHPAHIHSGTCETLGDVVFPLNNATAEGMMGTPTAGGDTMGTPEAGSGSTPMAGEEMEGEVVAMSSSTVEASLDDILAAEHAINVHLSPEEIEVYVACGDITGTAENGQLEVYLDELNDSGYTGEAMLMDNGDGTTTVDLMLMQSGEGMGGMAEATPSS